MATTNKFYNGLNKTLLFIEKHWKLILGIVVVCVILFSLKKCQSNHTLAKDIKTVNKFNDPAYTSEIKKWKDAYDKEHIRAENLVVENGAMKMASDSVAQLLHIKAKNVTFISKTGTEIALHEKLRVDSFVEVLPCPESDSFVRVKSKNFEWHDKWMSVNGTVGDYGDSVHVTGTDTLNRVDYTERDKILGLRIGKKHYFTDFNNSNPHIQTKGYKGLQLKETKKHWSVGASIEYGYPVGNFNLSKPEIHVGISLQYSLFRF